MIPDRERHAALAQRVEHLGDEPALVAELDRVQTLRQQVEPPAQTGVVPVEVLR
jgi:hypothetical protein